MLKMGKWERKRRAKAYKLKNKAKIAKQNRERQLKQYGLTLELYNALLLSQGGVCAICKTKPHKRSLNVDHDHLTGVVRGLLCYKCNKFRVSGNTLQTANAVVQYLSNPSVLP